MFKMSLENVAAEFSNLFRSADKEIELANDKKVSNMTDELIAFTPIDTGLARRSWGVTKMPHIYNVENTVPYIQHLNEGSSKQAPARFIEAIALKYGEPVGTIVDIVD